MSTVKDRPVKRRWVILLGRFTLNPLVRGMFKIGITPPKMALVETVGRRTGAVRRTPVVCKREGQTLWLVAQHGAHAGWVRNFQAKPEVRVRLGRRWLEGMAELALEDDAKARIRTTLASNWLDRMMTVATFRALESQPASVRIELTGGQDG